MGLDGNVQDQKFDMTYGNGFRSCWDDLKKYPSTGHGTIDAICRWVQDTRVKLVNAWARDDKSFPLHTDHNWIVAEYSIENL